MSFSFLPVAGDDKTWISTLGSFWGAIVGGIIAGAITLYGVRATIISSEEGISKTIEEQRAIREEEKRLATAKDRLLNLYQPVLSLSNEYRYRFYAKNFSQLSLEQKQDFILLLDKNIVYGDRLLNKKFIELTCCFDSKKPEDINLANEMYTEIIKIVSEEVEKLRFELGLPRLHKYDLLIK